MPVEWVGDLLESLSVASGAPYFLVKGVVVLVLVCLACGMVGSLVVGNRMAFFADTMAHCAFAGVTLGFLSLALAGVARDDAVMAWAVPLVMIAFGAGVGAAMVYVREVTGLAHDTVIGVFFAFAIGVGAMLFRVLQEVGSFNPEGFLFGSLLYVSESELFLLLVALVLVGGLFAWRYNQLVFASFNPSLARTRRVNLHLNNYLFIVLLAVVVNLSIRAVGALLINALLVVPAAAASNLARNLRQMFWLTVLFCVGSGLVGFWVSTAFSVRVRGGPPVTFGPSGTIVVVSVAAFFLTAALPALRAGRRPSEPADPPATTP